MKSSSASMASAKSGFVAWPITYPVWDVDAE
jgi:hypothetical protein